MIHKMKLFLSKKLCLVFSFPLLLILLSLLISKLDSFCLPFIRLLFLVLFFFVQDLLHSRTSLLAFAFLLFLLSLTSSLIPRSRLYFNLLTCSAVSFLF